MRKHFLQFIFLEFFFISYGCNDTLQCERHFLPKGYIGDVTIYFDQKNGQKEFDKNGCIIYYISLAGKCISALPLKEGITYPNITFKYFEFINQNKVKELREFDPNEFYSDSVKNRYKKYIYFIASGYKSPYYCYEYYVDYGINHKKYNNR